MDVPYQGGLHGGLPDLGDFLDQFAGAIKISRPRLHEGRHAERGDLTGRVAHTPRLRDRPRVVLDAACGVAGPLRHLTGDTGKPALAGSGPGGFGVKAACDESRGFLLIPFVVEGVARRPGKQDGRLFELLGARPGHDPLIPMTGFRPPVRVVEQEQRDREVRRQLQIARDRPLEGGTEIGQFIVDRVGGLRLIDALELVAQIRASGGIDFAMPGFHRLQQTGFVEFFPPKGLNGLQHSQQLMATHVPRHSTSSSIPPSTSDSLGIS